MAEETTSTAVAPAAPAKTKKAPHGTGNFLSRQLARRPKVSAMVMASIGAIGERDGASLLAIKKHMAGTYLVDVEKLSPFIHKYIMSAVAEGALLQTKGKGVNGSFKLANKAAAVAEKKAVAGGAKRKAPNKPKATVTKKVKREEASLRKKPKMLAAK